MAGAGLLKWFEGPGTVSAQTRNPSELAGTAAIVPFTQRHATIPLGLLRSLKDRRVVGIARERRPVGSSIMLMSTISSPRPSSQPWILVSHCTNVRSGCAGGGPAHLDLVLLGQVPSSLQSRWESPPVALRYPQFFGRLPLGATSPN